MEDRRLAIHEVADEVGISRCSTNTILTEDLGMRRVAAKFVPKLLSPEQQQLCFEVTQVMLECAYRGDELWVYGYDLETKVQASQWKHEAQKSTTGSEKCEGDTDCFFFDYRRVLHHEYTPLGQTVNKEYYQEVLCHLRDAVWRKRLELWDAHSWQLHHDNAPTHSSHLIQSFLAKHGIPQLRQAPCSRDMSPCVFWLFPILKTQLKSCRFDSCEDIIQNATAQLHAIQKEPFQNCFQRWKDRWAKCVESQGAYFEGD
ncbi:hypothetical protein B7P43_G06662 [Cryptotermes secundus]|uniref:Mariner Mos1 transposase n=1 Tax=Cryptotermes secundus TaxID=105785 RepID=A0A2J7Q2C1_9NEOP|nr:hypothetical protein B7P43_G06662 [Cryptotermes secundus]